MTSHSLLVSSPPSPLCRPQSLSRRTLSCPAGLWVDSSWAWPPNGVGANSRLRKSLHRKKEAVITVNWVTTRDVVINCESLSFSHHGTSHETGLWSCHFMPPWLLSSVTAQLIRVLLVHPLFILFIWWFLIQDQLFGPVEYDFFILHIHNQHYPQHQCMWKCHVSMFWISYVTYIFVHRYMVCIMWYESISEQCLLIFGWNHDAHRMMPLQKLILTSKHRNMAFSHMLMLG